jgi:hypothetical protein
MCSMPYRRLILLGYLFDPQFMPGISRYSARVRSSTR